MDNREIEKLYRFEQFYWWHTGRRFIIDSFLGKFLKTKKDKILEIGCGTGGNIKILKKYGRFVVGLDVSEKALDFCRNKNFDKLILGDIEYTNLNNNFFDIVLALDVLEHIENDKKAIQNIYRILKQGGVFLITVPSYQFLWSEHDIALNHFRRYSFNKFLNKVERAGFKVIKASYCVSFVFPMVLAYRMLRKVVFSNSKKNTAYISLPIPINNFFIYILKIEAFLLRYIKFYFGTSIICLAQKPVKPKSLKNL